MDKIRRGFFWKGSEVARGGSCLVAWAKVKRPKKLGGLGVLDLEFFSRALRLRWLWFQWKDPERPWVGADTPCNEVDKHLFRLCTTVTVGNGNKAKFWESSWLYGRAPRDIASNLYRLAWRKNLAVSEEIVNQNWTRGLWRMTTVEEMAELVGLWGLINEVSLNDQEDKIKWRWTPDGNYSAKSAYKIQLRGSYCTFDSNAIWGAWAEGKHRLFAWLLVQSKVLTADKLLARNWPCNPLCSLCDQVQETAQHSALHCVFAKEVWLLVANWTNGLVQVPKDGIHIEDWWNSELSGLPKQMKRNKAAAIIYTVWNVWKERNRRVFESASLSPARVFSVIKEDMNFRDIALCGRPRIVQ